MKERRITIDKAAVRAEIDALTFKFGDASDRPDGRQLSAVESDSGEGLDAALINGHIEYRDGQLRKFMQTNLRDEEVTEASSGADVSETFTYDLVVDDGFRDVTLRPLALLMHRYLVYGALLDWYGFGIGSEHATSFAGELAQIERDIDSTLRVPSRRKRPLQPFGPAKKGGMIL